jgi:hypothetical protein
VAVSFSVAVAVVMASMVGFMSTRLGHEMSANL